MLNIVILAAGFGKRMKSNLPKSMHKISGKPMLSHILDNIRMISPDLVVVVVGYGAEIIKKKFDNIKNIKFVIQKIQRGTGHALKKTIPIILKNNRLFYSNSLTLVMYGDVPLVKTNTLYNLLINCKKGISILTENIENSKDYGRIIRNSSGIIKKIIEYKDANNNQKSIKEVSTGILCISTEILINYINKLTKNNFQKEFYLTQLIELASNDNKIINTVKANYKYETLGINNRFQNCNAETIFQKEQTKYILKNGTTLLDIRNFFIRGYLSCGKDVIIDSGCIFEGYVYLADKVHIGPYCIIKNVKLSDGVKIEAFSNLENAFINESSKIGPYSRLRFGVKILSKVKIGNFVEIKNSIINNNSKLNHLSYIGDASLGKNINVGACAITCNYDGIKKHRVIIRNNSFIGSNNQLISPTILGRYTKLGSGTILSKDTMSYSLIISDYCNITKYKWKFKRI